MRVLLTRRIPAAAFSRLEAAHDVDLSLDGELQERPRNLWSRLQWADEAAVTS